MWWSQKKRLARWNLMKCSAEELDDWKRGTWSQATLWEGVINQAVRELYIQYLKNHLSGSVKRALGILFLLKAWISLHKCEKDTCLGATQPPSDTRKQPFYVWMLEQTLANQSQMHTSLWDRSSKIGSIRTDFIWRASGVLLLATGYRQTDANSFEIPFAHQQVSH